MTRKKRGRTGPSGSVRQQPPAAPPRRSGRSVTIGAVVVAILIAIAVILRLARQTPNGSFRGDRIELPPPVDSLPPFAPVASDFAGADRCASCHATQYAAWRGSTHGQAGGVPGTVKVIAPFNGTPIRFRDALVVPSAGRGYTFTVRQEGRPDRTFTVDAVVGGGHMVGGGTQAFVSKFPDGTWRLLPFDWSRQTATWFCNTETRLGKGWVPITSSLALADCGDWPPQRILGDEPRFANCQGCHGSQIDIRFDSAAKRWNTNVASLAINCESCHGPAQRHVDLMTAARNGEIPSATLRGTGYPADIGLRLTRHVDQGPVAWRLLPVPRAQVAAREALLTGRTAHHVVRAPPNAARRRGPLARRTHAHVRVSGGSSLERMLHQRWDDVHELPRSAHAGLPRRVRDRAPEPLRRPSVHILPREQGGEPDAAHETRSPE